MVIRIRASANLAGGSNFMFRPKFLPCWCADKSIPDPREVSGVPAIGEENLILHIPTTPLSGKDSDVKYRCYECGTTRRDE